MVLLPKLRFFPIAVLFFICTAKSGADIFEQDNTFLESLSPTLNSITDLESSRDPKCHATATRLQNLIYGTPLSEGGRFKKTDMQKAFVSTAWHLAKPGDDGQIDKVEISNALQRLVKFESSENTTKAVFPNSEVEINHRDSEHYGTVAYSLRAILAVQQELMLSEYELPFLTAPSVDELKWQLDLVTLALLKTADQAAREQSFYQVDENLIAMSWKQLFGDKAMLTPELVAKSDASVEKGLQLLESIIEGKLASYAAYNNVANQIFSRNLQVYFARMKLPQNPNASLAFRTAYTEAMITFSANLYLTAQNFAKEFPLIKEEHVAEALKVLLPHQMNEYEDAIFFTQLDRSDQIIIEAYDMDSFRDGGLHWKYLGEAVNDIKPKISKAPDPFASELLSEAVANYGVLLLRVAGSIGREEEAGAISNQLVVRAYHQISETAEKARNFKSTMEATKPLVSSGDATQTSQRYFNEVSSKWGVDFVHHSSDWLSRLLRSYLKSGQNTGNITIPPAFGGSGVAAEDINNDGLIDLLLLGGRGNKLYLNRGDSFQDITKSAGLEWTRSEDNLPGEVRQPLIADWDNDGDQDIIITYVNDPHRVYRNNGDLTFSDITTEANLGGAGLVGGPATTVDINNDGLLDIYIQYFGDYLRGVLPTLARRNSNGLPDALFINKGGFKFEKAPESMMVRDPGWGQSVTHTDLNQDGWQDLISGNDFGINSYFINRNGETFVDVAAHMGTDKPSFTMSLAHADLNQDGYVDIYVSNIVTMNKDEKYVLPSKDTTMKLNPDKLGNMRVVESNDLFMSNTSTGSLQYTLSQEVGRGHSSTGWAWDADFFDVDNDSDDDLYVLNGMNDYYVYSTENPYYTDPIENKQMNATFPQANKASNVFFINSGGKLNNVSAMSGLDFISNSRSAAYLDMDGDGDLDVVTNDYHGPARLFENNAEMLGNNWLKIRLEGSPESGVNRDAIGAQLVLVDGDKLYVWRQISGSEGYMSVHPKVQHFGIQKRKHAHLLIIWPNGKRQKVANLEANRTHVIAYNPS